MQIHSGDRWLRALCVLTCWCLFISACGEDKGPDTPAAIVETVRLGQGAPAGLYVYGEEILVEFDRDPGEVTITYDGAPGPDVVRDGTGRVFVVLTQTINLTWDGGSETFTYLEILAEHEVGPILVATEPAVDGPPVSASAANADGISLLYNMPLWESHRTIQRRWFTAFITTSDGDAWTPEVTHDERTLCLKPPAGLAFLSGETYTVTITGGSAFNDWFDFTDELQFTFE